MTRFIERGRASSAQLLPECLEDSSDESNPVSALDAFINTIVPKRFHATKILLLTGVAQVGGGHNRNPWPTSAKPVMDIHPPAEKSVESSSWLRASSECPCGESRARHRTRCTIPGDRAASSVPPQDHREPSARACHPNRCRPRARHAWSLGQRDATT